MANSIPTYTKIPIPFANSGDKNSIPQNATGSNLASYSEGFPPITSQPITENGIPPERGDFNGLGFSTTNNISYLQQGGLYTFDTQLSSAIGGYAQGAILAYINNGQLYYLRSKINNNTYNFNTNSSYIGQYWEYAFGQGNTGGFSIGSIFAYPSALPPEGAYLLNGQTIENCDTLYPEFWEWLNTADIRKISEETYETYLSQYGYCGAFCVWSSTGKVRLPTYTNAFLMGGDSTNIGRDVAAGLPNIEGSLGYTDSTSSLHKGLLNIGNNDPISGAFTANYTTKKDFAAGSTSNKFATGLTFDASLSNSTYGNSNTVQPPAIRVSWCIQVFNAATALSEQESAQLASQMQMKAQKDLGNVDSNLDFVVESWNDDNGNWYRVYRSGWVEQGGYVSNSKPNTLITTTFLKSFNNVNYCLNITSDRSSSSTTAIEIRELGYIEKNTTFFTKYLAGKTNYEEGFNWYACGQGAN